MCVLKVFVILLLWNTVSCQPFVVLDPSKIFGYSLGVEDFWLHAFHVGALDVCVAHIFGSLKCQLFDSICNFNFMGVNYLIVSVILILWGLRSIWHITFHC